MKPVFIKYLLTQKACDKVIYVDSDIFFYNDYQFLFDKLDNNSILLTPHWRTIHSEIDLTNFELLFTGGLYNAGFIGVTKEGIAAMEWWANACLDKCVVDKTKGLFVDQTYLNLLPIYFETVEVLKHQGCNVAGWNIPYCQRQKHKEQILINAKYPVIFIHFAKVTINNILKGEDTLLLPYLQQYEATLRRYQQGFQFKIKYGKMSNQSPFLKRIKNFLLFHLDRL